MDEPWCYLKPGDRVRIVRVPSEFLVPGARVAPETLEVFRVLAAARAVLTIESVNAYGDPWTEGFDIDGEGRVTPSGTGHSVSLSDDSWEKVEDE